MANLVGIPSNGGHSTHSRHIDSSTPGNGRQPEQPVDWYMRLCEQGKRPSIAEAVAIHATASPTELTALLCADLAQRWQQGEHVRAEQFLEQFPHLLTGSDDAIDLIYREFLEQEKAGQSATADQYALRFPQFADELRAQIEFHQALHDPSANSQGSFELVSAESEVPVRSKPSAATDPSFKRQPTSLDGRESEPTESIAPQVQGYDILEEIGRGGMGVVFKARHRKLDRLVALKMLLEGPFSNHNHARRFLVEAKASARLQHPGIVQIHEVGEHEGRPFLAFEYIDGGTLAEHIRGRSVQPMAAAAIVESLARAVQFAHERSVVHRDLKPSNVMLQRIDSPANAPSRTTLPKPFHEDADARRGGENPDALLSHRFQFKITDFGLAKFVEDHADPVSGATIAGDIMGTAAYMSPEQARGDSPKSAPASDIYSLGAVLYELLTGRAPFVGTRPIDVLAQVVTDEPVRPSQLVRRMPADLQTICLKCLEKNPQRRYSSALALAEELARFQANIPIIARRRNRIERGWSWCRRHPVTAVSLASIATLLLTISVVTTVYSLLLKDQLTQTKSAELAEKDAKKQAIVRLWGSYLAEANAKRNSRQIGQRYDSLASIKSAQALGDSIDLDERRIAAMRETAIACLALPDVRIERSPSISIALAEGINFDTSRTRFAYRTAENEIFVRRVSDNQIIAEFKNRRGGHSIPLLSCDGRWLMILNDHCRIYGLDQIPPVQVFESPSSGWWSFAPDNTKILGANGKGELALIDFATGKVIQTYGSLVARLSPLISPDQSRAAIASDEAIHVLDLKTGDFVQYFDRPFLTGSSQPCAWHPNGAILAIGPYEIDGVVLWDVVTGAKLASANMWGGSFTPTFNSTGSLLLGYAGWNASLFIWNVETHEMEFAEKGLGVTDPRADANGGFSLLTNVGEKYSTSFVEPSTVLRSLPIPLGWQAMRTNSVLVYSRDGRYLAHCLNGQVFLYETNSLRLLDRVLTGTEYGFAGFDFQGSLLTLTDLGLMRWPISSSEPPTTIEPGGGSQNVSFGPPVKIIDSGAHVDFAVSRDGKQFAIPTADGVQIYRDDEPDKPMLLSPHLDVRSTSFSADGKMLASGGWGSGTARIWSLETGQLIKTLDEPICCSVAFSPDGRYLVTNSDRVRIWSTTNWELLSTVEVQGASASGVNVCFSPDGRLLAVSDAVARVHLVDPETGTAIATLTNPHQAGTSMMAFDPTGNRLAVACGDSAYIWDLRRLEESLVKSGLGWPASEKSLSVAHTPTIAGGNPNHATSAIRRDNSNEDSQPSNPTATLDAHFVLDEHFQQLAIAEHLLRAQRAIEHGEFGFAKYLLAQAVAQDPTTGANCNNLAWVLATGPAAVRDSKNAETLARRAVALAPDQATYLNTLGVALYRTGKYAEAITALEKSLSQNPPFNQPYDLLFLAMCHAQIGDSKNARQCQERASQLMQEHNNGQNKVWHDELQEFSDEAKSTLTLRESRTSDAATDYD